MANPSTIIIAPRATDDRRRPISELKRPPRPSFRGKSHTFVGRKEDITKLKQYLTESNTPISIVGEGGIGKSALAFNAIHECQDMFDIIIPIYFESVLKFDGFLLEIAKSLQLPMTMKEFEQFDNIEVKADIIRDGLCKSGRVLIYADNYETIRNSIINKSLITEQARAQEKEDAIMINEFLQEVPDNAYIILTSRERRNLRGERTMPLEGLNVQEGYELFVEVAGNKLPNKIPAEIKKAIEQISEKTGGHPLAIEILASAYVEILLPELTEMLEHLGAGVVNPEKGKESRHKSLEACFGYSISKLPETHKSLLPKLALMFKSPFPPSAVEYIVIRDDSNESTIKSEETAILRDLHNSSLLRRIDFDDHGDIEGKYRLYHFHPSVRNYLEHKVQQDDGYDKQQELERKYEERFPLYYYKLLAECDKAIGTKDHVFSLERFNNILYRGNNNDFHRAISLAGESPLATTMLNYLGLILWRLGFYKMAIQYYDIALVVDKRLGDEKLIARDYANCGLILQDQGNHKQALEYHKNALKLHETLGDKVGTAADYTNIGSIVANDLNNYNDALQYFKRALAIDEELQDRAKIAEDYRNIGDALQDQGNHKQALEYHNKSLGIHKLLNDKGGMAKTYRHIGLVLRDLDNYNDALQYFKRALTLHEELQDKAGMAENYTKIANILYMQARHDQALEYYNKALALHDELNNKAGMAKDYRNISFLFYSQYKYPQALDYNKKALTLHEELQDRVEIAADYSNIGNVLVNMEDYNGAIESFKRGLQILKELEEQTGYHHPFIGTIQQRISELHHQNEGAYR